MVFEVELYFPTARPGAAAEVESLGECKVLTPNVFITVTEHNGEAHLVALDGIVEIDQAQHRYTTALGRTLYPRQIDFPDHFFVETQTGHARPIKGVQIARLVRSKRDAPGKGVTW